MIIDWGTQYQTHQAYFDAELGLSWWAYPVGFIMELFPKLSQQYNLDINIYQQYDLETNITG